MDKIPFAKKQPELFGTAAMTFYLDFLGSKENATVRGMDASFVKEANCPMICNTYFIIYHRGITQEMEIKSELLSKLNLTEVVIKHYYLYNNRKIYNRTIHHI